MLNMKLYVIIDSTLAPGAQAAQAVHAALAFAAEQRKAQRAWYLDSNNVVLLAAENEDHLQRLASLAQHAGLPLATFREPDFDNRLTGIAMLGAARLVSSLPLALRQAAAA
jgi:peptidyl-tRNA hydrolase